MNNTTIDAEWLNQLEGLQFVPVKNKAPIVQNWQTTVTKYNLKRCEAVGLVCGKPSGGVEAIDFDLKYDLTGKLYPRFTRIINDIDDTIIPAMVIQQTKSGGFHWIYRCSVISGNEKLARRPATEDERLKAYKAQYDIAIQDLSIEDPVEREKIAKSKAEKEAKGCKVFVLIETRGDRGQVVCYPTPDYKIVQGSLTGIHTITPEQREILFSVARQFNEVFKEHTPPRADKPHGEKGLSPFEDYNNRGDVIGLLEKHGWKIVEKKGSKTVFLRPGPTTSASSGNFDSQKNWFSVFTTSSEFEPETAYQPYAVYTMLECGGNYSEASKKLYDEGYGERREQKQANNSAIPTRVNLIDDDYSFIAGPKDYEDYLTQVRDGTLQMGLSTGFDILDKHFLFKRGTFVIINGLDNVGKTAVLLYLALLAAMLHGWVWLIFSSENSVGYCIRRLCEYYWNKKLRRQTAQEYQEAKDFVEKHFVFIRSEDELFNYRDIVTMARKAMRKQHIDAVLLDPYNSLKIELTNQSKISTHEYHYEAISEIKLFTKQTGCCFYINTHAITSAGRVEAGKLYPKAPKKYDTEGGAKFSNKADDFLTIHRLVQHPDEWMLTQVHVRKIKETETGGKVTSEGAPVVLRMVRGGCGFSEGDTDMPATPTEKWHAGVLISKPNIQQVFNWTAYQEDGDDAPF